MNIRIFPFWKAVFTTLFAAVVLCASADPMPSVPRTEKNYTGIVISVDTNRQVVRIKRSFLPAKQFAYRNNCEISLLYAMLKNGVGTAGDLRRGEKVTVSYQDLHNVHIADRIEQQPMQLSGTVKEIHLEKHRLTLNRWLLAKRMDIAADCITVLGDHKAGTLTDIHSGDHVVVIYEVPGGDAMAWQITKNNPPITGTLRD